MGPITKMPGLPFAKLSVFPVALAEPIAPNSPPIDFPPEPVEAEAATGRDSTQAEEHHGTNSQEMAQPMLTFGSHNRSFVPRCGPETG